MAKLALLLTPSLLKRGEGELINGGEISLKNKGFALLTIMFLALILFFIELTLFAASETHHQVMDGQVYDTKAYYLSQAGFYDALTRLRTGSIYPLPAQPSQYTQYAISEGGKQINIAIYGVDGVNYQIKTNVEY
ncbi:MAG: hypothetical protein M1536_02135 [Firmicutes bacterium]|nr:hypothetical protein [Bacillota bacterium]